MYASLPRVKCTRRKKEGVHATTESTRGAACVYLLLDIDGLPAYLYVSFFPGSAIYPALFLVSAQIRLGVIELRIARFLNFEEEHQKAGGQMGLSGKLGLFLKEVSKELVEVWWMYTRELN